MLVQERVYTGTVIAAFIDESGNDGQSQVFAMATVLLSYRSSYYFGNDWQAMLRDFSVSEFHACDFHASRGEFRWSDDRHTAFEHAAVKLFQDWQVKHSAVLVSNEDYKRSFVDTGFHKTLRPAISKWKKPYLQAFQHTVLNLREYADHQQAGYYIIPVFDRCQEFMGQARQDYALKNKDGKLGRMHVSTSRGYVQLQAADFFAWEYRVNAERCIATEHHEPGPVLGALREHMFGAKLWSFGSIDYLRRRVEAVHRGIDPESVSPPETRRTQ